MAFIFFTFITIHYILFSIVTYTFYKKFKKHSEIRLGDICYILMSMIPIIGFIPSLIGLLCYIEDNKHKVIFKLKGK